MRSGWDPHVQQAAQEKRGYHRLTNPFWGGSPSHVLGAPALGSNTRIQVFSFGLKTNGASQRLKGTETQMEKRTRACLIAPATRRTSKLETARGPWPVPVTAAA